MEEEVEVRQAERRRQACAAQKRRARGKERQQRAPRARSRGAVEEAPAFKIDPLSRLRLGEIASAHHSPPGRTNLNAFWRQSDRSYLDRERHPGGDAGRRIEVP